MRIKHLSLIILVAAAFVSCKKDGVNAVKGATPVAAISPTLSQVEGKWQITQVTTYSIDSLNNKSNVVTYKQPLSDQNYVQFNADSTCVWSADHYYVFGASQKLVSPQASLRVAQYQYLVNGSSISLSQLNFGPQGPMGPEPMQENDSATMPTANSLVIHSDYYNYDNNTQVVSDTYYARQ